MTSTASMSSNYQVGPPCMPPAPAHHPTSSVTAAGHGPRLECTRHVFERVYERFPRMRGMTIPQLHAYLARSVAAAVDMGESVLKDQRFCRILLGDQTPLILVVRDRPNQPMLAITALTQEMAMACGTMVHARN